MIQRPEEYRKVWQHKSVLRAIYSDFYQQIVDACRKGPSLEIGGGAGNFKEFCKEVISTDIVSAPWLDVVADAHALPFDDCSFENIIGVDVVHHLERPRRFFEEAARLLKAGGRLILVEPCITPVSWVFYTLFHEEPVQMGVDPLADGPLTMMRRPFDANQAIPTLLFGRYRRQFQKAFPLLHLERFARHSLFAYPLSGGFRSWCLVPASCIQALLWIERTVAPAIGRLMGFRLLAVIEKRSIPPTESDGELRKS